MSAMPPIAIAVDTSQRTDAVSLLDHLVGKQKERFRDLIARDRSLDLRDRNHCLSVDLAPYSGSLMPASRITLAYFSVSAA
jgi:hypothetical protein